MTNRIIRLSVIIFLVVTASVLHALEKDVPFVPTPESTVDAMLTLANVGPEDTVIDLGSGDGRIVIAAAKRGARATGIDIDPERIREADENAKENNVQDRVKFIRQNLFDADIKPATVLTMYLLPSVNLKLRPKLLKDLRPGTRVVSHAFDLGNWEPDKRLEQVYLWIVPANVSGQWHFEPQDKKGSVAVLNLKQQFQKVNGTIAVGGGTYQIRNVKLSGNQLQFTADEGGDSRRYRFTAKEDSLEGGPNPGMIDAGSGDLLKATRVQGTKMSIEGTQDGF